MANSNAEQSLRDILVESIRTINTMMTKIDSLPQFPPNPKFISPKASQNAMPTNLGPEQNILKFVIIMKLGLRVLLDLNNQI